MKTIMHKLLALMLAVTMLASFALPALALGEGNTQGVVFTATLDKTELVKSSDAQTVVMTICASSGIEFSAMNAIITNDDALTLSGIAGGDSRIVLTGANYNLREGSVIWTSGDAEAIQDVTQLLRVTFTVPGNTPAGTYQVGMKELTMSKNYGTVEMESGTAYATATLTITEPSAPAAGYNATITCGVSEVTVEDSVSVNVGVNHDSKTAFAASEVKLSYDASKLSFNESESTLNGAKVKDANGVLTIENYGADKNCGTGVYVLNFTAVADGTAVVNLTSAAFSDKEGAVKSDLNTATLGSSTVNLTVNKKTFAVTLPDIYTGASTVTDGESYTFAAKDTANYTYSAPTATVGGVSAAVTDNGDGTYTVANVTGALVISGTRTPKSYTVTFAGNAASEVTGASKTAFYDTDYSFTLPSAEGWTYSLSSVTVGGTAYTGYSVSGNNVYTIPGADIKGDVVITVNRSQTTASVSVVGNGAGAAAGYVASADIGSAYSLTITPVAGYSYSVTATMGGTPTTPTKNGDTYTIASVTGNIVFTVEQSVITDGVSVSEYLTLDGTRMWLVKNDAALASGSVATYDGQPMFVKGGVYCTLVIAKELTSAEAAAKVGIAAGTAVPVSGMDVNMSEKVDVNDAQLTYNMYNKFYNAFTDDVTVEKFLRADVNGDGVINVLDAEAIISEILK